MSRISEVVRRKILVIDDNKAIHRDFRAVLERAAPPSDISALEAELFGGDLADSPLDSYTIESAYQGEAGYERAKEAIAAGDPFPLAFVDMRMPPGWDGLKTIEQLWQLDPELQIVLCTAYSDYSWGEIIARIGTTDRLLVLRKPFDTIEVQQMVTTMIGKWELMRSMRAQVAQLRAQLDEVRQRAG